MKRSVVILTFVLFSAFLTAQTAVAPATGDGSELDPYQIASLDNLYWIAAGNDVVPSPDMSTRQSSHYVQTTDIDAYETIDWFPSYVNYTYDIDEHGDTINTYVTYGPCQGWLPIASFSGSYDGDGYTVANLYLNRTSQSHNGFFSFLMASASVTNLGLVNCDITGGSHSGTLAADSYGHIENVYVTGTAQFINGGGLVALNRSLINNSYTDVSVSTPSGVDFSAGGFASYNEGTIQNSHADGDVLVNGSGSGAGLVITNYGTIENCRVSGSVDVRWGGYAGGLVSENRGNINRSYAEGAVFGTSLTGGFCAYNNTSGIIEECYASGNVTDVAASTHNCSGGFLGWNAGTVRNSFARGSVSLLYATSGLYYPAGFAGHNENGVISHCFSTGYVNFNDGLKGFAARVVEGLDYEMNGNFWDIETSRQGGTAGGATGALSSQMKTPGTFITAGWDFAEIWGMDATINNGYPCLLWQHPGVEVGAPPLFFSEYIEGSSNNKALEIYNASETDTFALDFFRIIIAQNGGGWTTHHNFPSGALLAPGAVWVMLAEEAEDSLYDPAAADELIPWASDGSSPVHFNGDDARGLEYSPDGGSTWYLIDVFGDPDNDPGDYWLVDEGSTKDHTLLRKSYVTQGNTVWDGRSGSQSEWLAYPINTFDYLGEHPSTPVIPPDTTMTEIATLAQLREFPEETPFIYTGSAQVTFVQSWRGQKFIQDESAAILIDDNAGMIKTPFIAGDGISGISGSTMTFGNMLQLVPDDNALTAEAPPVAVQTITLAEFKNNFEAYEAELIKLVNVRFIDADGATIVKNGTVYPITDDVDTVLFRASFYDVEYIGDTIPANLMDITGIANARSEGNYITARGYSDFYMHGEEAETYMVSFRVDMSTYPGFDPDTGAVPMITGSFFDWAAPGDMPESQGMVWTGSGMIYSKTLELEAGSHQYKYFMGSGWDGGEWPGDPNRQINVSAGMTVNDTWGQLLPDGSGVLSGGSGTVEDPYLIATAQDLDSVRYYMGEGVYFRQIADIDLGVSPWSDGEGWVPIGTYPEPNAPFTGYYDGNGFAVNYLTMRSTAAGYKGLFGANAGTVIALRVENAAISDHGSRCGILAGMNLGNIEHCSSSGTISTDHAGGRIGGLCAWNSGLIASCFSTADVTLFDTEGSEGVAGGLAASNMGDIRDCYAVGTVRGTYKTGGLVGQSGGNITESYAAGDMVSGYISSGGLAGLQQGGLIGNCYATPDVEASYNSGGLAGILLHGDIYDSYSLGEVFGHANAGGLVGYAFGHTVTNSCWDMERSRILHSAAGEGKNADEMLMDPSTFTGWNTEAYWRIESGIYPYLQWQGEPGPQNRPQELLPEYWLVFHLDMNNVDVGFENSVDKVYISGNMHALTGLDWPEPGSQPAYEMQYVGGGFWTVGMRVMPGTYEYKFFINNGWERGEWIGEPNRCVTVSDFTVVNDVWALMPDTSALEMYYPNSVIAFSSEFRDSTMFPDAWSAQQLLGPPDAYPYHDVKSGLVWNPETADGQREFVELGFETPVYASGVMIYETFGAGAVDTVYVRNAGDGSWHEVWSGYAGAMHSVSRIFPVMFERTAFMVDAVRLAINSPAVSGWQEYDAVALAGTTDPGSAAMRWALQIGAARAEHGDPENYLGVATDALDAFDNRDMVEAPPAPETPIALYFPHPEWEHALGDNFCVDIRADGKSLYFWDFDVFSADTGTVSLNFTYYTIPEDLPLVLEDLHSGTELSLADGGEYSYFSAAGETRSFRITAGDDTPPALTLGESFSGPRILKAGSEYLLDWSITGAFDLSSVDILLSKDDALYERIISLGAEYDYLWTLPELMLVRKAKLLLIAVSSGGDTLMAASDHPFAIAGDLMEIDIPAGWLLWGMPMLPENSSMSQNLADDLTEYYVVYDYFSGAYRFADILKEAAGYWLGSLAAATVTVGGEPFTDPYDLALEPGWNLISNPLVTDVDIDSLIFMKDDQVKTRAQALSAGWINGMYACDSPDSGYYAPQALELCRGYWLSVLEENVWVQFPIHRDPVPAPAPMQKSGSSDAVIDFIAENGSLRNEMLRIGILPEASAGFDPAFDAVAPPPPPTDTYLELYVPRPDLNSILGNKFVRDIRAIPAEGAYEEWVLELHAGMEPVSVGWTLGALSEGMQAAFAPEGEAEFRDMQSVTDITIADGQRLIVRIGANVVGIAEDMLPAAFTLESNYPNPFNPSTTIRYALPEAARVRLSIYDLSGRLVRTLVSAEENPGYKQVVWNGRNQAGDALSSGVYLYRLEAGEFVQTRKMLFLK